MEKQKEKNKEKILFRSPQEEYGWKIMKLSVWTVCFDAHTIHTKKMSKKTQKRFPERQCFPLTLR